MTDKNFYSVFWDGFDRLKKNQQRAMMNESARSEYVQSLIRRDPEPKPSPSDDDVDAVALKAFVASSVNVWGGGDVQLTTWPEEVSDEQREWCRTFAKAVIEQQPAPKSAPLPPPTPKPTTARGFSPEDLYGLLDTRAIVREVRERLGQSLMSPELQRIHKKLVEAEEWLNEKIQNGPATK